MSIAVPRVMGKPIMPFRLRPTPREGLNIQYKLRDSEETFTSVGKRLHITKQTVCNVVHGRRRSTRIESEIARILGKASWNDVVLEARSEIQKKPVAVIVREMEQRFRKGMRTCTPEMLARTNWEPLLKAYAEERARGKK